MQIPGQPVNQVKVPENKANQAVQQPVPVKATEPKQHSMTLDVLSLNTFGLPDPIGQKVAERHLRIGQSIKEYEIIGFQEAFSKDSRNLEIGAQSTGEDFQVHTPENRRLLSSGLSTFSKYEIVEQDFKAFKYSSHADSLAAKGVSFTRLRIPEVGLVDVYNTHFQAATDKADNMAEKLLLEATGLVIPGFDMPRDQIREHDAQVLLDLVKAKDQGHPILLMGDFNSQDHQKVYETLSKAGFKDSFDEARPDDPGYTSDGATNPYKSDPNKRKRVDYIFYRPGKEVDIKVLNSQLAFGKAVDGMFVSDHYGVHTQFEFKPK